MDKFALTPFPVLHFLPVYNFPISWSDQVFPHLLVIFAVCWSIISWSVGPSFHHLPVHHFIICRSSWSLPYLLGKSVIVSCARLNSSGISYTCICSVWLSMPLKFAAAVPSTWFSMPLQFYFPSAALLIGYFIWHFEWMLHLMFLWLVTSSDASHIGFFIFCLLFQGRLTNHRFWMVFEPAKQAFRWCIRWPGLG